jgi:drug/metabolite transporter (DMT)-like permease
VSGSAGRASVLGAALLFSTGGAAIKATQLSGFQVASFRSAVAALAMALLLPAARRRWSKRTLFVALAYAATMVLFVTANKLTTAANTIFLQSSAPLYVLLLSVTVLKERVRASDVAYMLVLGVGLGLFFVASPVPDRLAPDPFLGNALATAAGVSWALTVFGLRWLELREPGVGALPATLLGNLVAALLCLPLALPVANASTNDVLAILYLGVFQIGLAYLLLTRAAMQVPALEMSLLLLVEPVLNPIWAFLLHREMPSLGSLAGGSLILGATAVRTGLAFARARASPSVGG